MNNNRDIVTEDLNHIWHPCTQMKDHETLPLIPIERAKGVYLYDFEDNRYIDAISSWWVNIFGHTNDYISSKVKEQLDTLEHVLLAGFTHKPAVDLANRLVDITPEGLEKVFFADNGSSAVEVALKMSFHYHRNMGENRPLFLSLSNSYHGETIGALSVGDVELYKETYEPLLISCIQTPVPLDQSVESADVAIEELKRILEERGGEISAFIVEPLVQGAGYMNMYHPIYLTKAKALCEEYGVHLIADEIMTGFGRTGTMFASEQADIVPDFMTLSKGLTGGYLPLAVVMTNNTIYNAFYCDYSEYKAFLHSHSYTGNPLACSSALATLELFEKSDVLGENREKSAYILEKLERFKSLPNVKEVRQTGMITAIELKGYKAEERVGLKVYQYGLDNGVLLRPLGHIIYFMPPYIITYEQIDKMVDTAYSAISKLLPAPHTPVLLDEVLESFKGIKSGYFVDCTLGYAGHSKAILERFENIEQIGIDRDIEALNFSKNRLEQFRDRTTFYKGTFSSILPTLKESPIVAILADFGVSSLQLDKRERGFSFDSENLDMRMDSSSRLTAYDVVNGYSRERLEYILNHYGEVRQYRKVANAIINARAKEPISSAKELSDLVSKVVPRGKIHPATLTFQGIRIEVNSELAEIEGLLDSLEERAKGGTLKGAIVSLITFHSLEDRLVKKRYKKWSKSCICDPNAIRCSCGKGHELGRVLSRKPIVASKEELKLNPRSRSAKLRTFIFKG